MSGLDDWWVQFTTGFSWLNTSYGVHPSGLEFLGSRRKTTVPVKMNRELTARSPRRRAASSSDSTSPRYPAAGGDCPPDRTETFPLEYFCCLIRYRHRSSTVRRCARTRPLVALALHSAHRAHGKQEAAQCERARVPWFPSDFPCAAAEINVMPHG